MEILIGIVAVVLAVAVILCGIFAMAGTRRLKETYARLAKYRNGTFDPGGWSGPPRVRFMHRGSPVVIDVIYLGGNSPAYYTQIHFLGFRSVARCGIYPEGRWSTVGKLLGMDDIESGSPGFDKRYVIKGSDGSVVCQLLTPEVRYRIEQLRSFLSNDDIYVEFSRQRLLIKKRSRIDDYMKLAIFADLAIELFDDLLATAPQEGVTFVPGGAEKGETAAICQICGETLDSNVVFCQGCGTPHHEDCWRYFGACSTYGCGVTKYVSSRARFCCQHFAGGLKL